MSQVFLCISLFFFLRVSGWDLRGWMWVGMFAFSLKGSDLETLSLGTHGRRTETPGQDAADCAQVRWDSGLHPSPLPTSYLAEVPER